MVLLVLFATSISDDCVSVRSLPSSISTELPISLKAFTQVQRQLDAQKINIQETEELRQTLIESLVPYDLSIKHNEISITGICELSKEEQKTLARIAKYAKGENLKKGYTQLPKTHILRKQYEAGSFSIQQINRPEIKKTLKVYKNEQIEKLIASLENTQQSLKREKNQNEMLQGNLRRLQGIEHELVTTKCSLEEEESQREAAQQAEADLAQKYNSLVAKYNPLWQNVNVWLEQLKTTQQATDEIQKQLETERQETANFINRLLHEATQELRNRAHKHNKQQYPTKLMRKLLEESLDCMDCLPTVNDQLRINTLQQVQQTLAQRLPPAVYAKNVANIARKIVSHIPDDQVFATWYPKSLAINFINRVLEVLGAEDREDREEGSDNDNDHNDYWD